MKIKENQKNNIKLTLSIAFLLVLVISATYAIVGANITYDSSNIAATLGTRPIFVSDASDQVSLEIPYIEVEVDEEHIIASSEGTIDISLSTGYNASARCTYDIYWVWDETSDTNAQYIKTEGATKEYTISGTNGNESFSEVQVNNYDANNLKTFLHSGVIVSFDGEINYQTWNITAGFYKTKAIQSAHQGASYTGTIQVENVVCDSNVESLSDSVLALEQAEDYTSSQDSSIYRVVDQNGIRYEGNDPDNYVEYNGEEWRIIGVFDGADIGLESGKKYTKIARSTPIGNMAWNSTLSYENDWVNSTLYQYLNGEYLNSLSDEAKEMIAKYNDQYSTWHLLGPTWSEFQNYYTPDMYRAERDITVGKKGYRNGVADSADPSATAAIGLMYTSDYGYAAYGENCDNESTEILNDYNLNCAAVDWLMYYNPDEGYYYEWLISPRADSSLIAFVVGLGGSVRNGIVDIGEIAVRPVLYLDSDVVIADGTGKQSDPYKLYKEPPQLLSDTVLALEQAEDYISSQDGTIYRVVDQNGVRYEGNDPDNYVEFNNEEWRIIGVFDGSDIGLESGKKYTKIARSTPLDTYRVWDYNTSETIQYENDWVNSTLYQYLNGEYLSSLSDEAKEMIAQHNNQYSTWHLLGPTRSEFKSYHTPDMYIAERDLAVGKKGYRNGTAESADPSVPAAIGLMYPSDYGYAAYGENCDNETTDTLYYYDENCGAVDWLMYETFDEWLISPSADGSGGAFSAYAGGFVDSGNIIGKTAVRPVLYLDASVSLFGGTGQQGDNAYKLG